MKVNIFKFSGHGNTLFVQPGFHQLINFNPLVKPSTLETVAVADSD
jgi:hypothetical protein